ncbi:MAG: RNA 2'-phosphotransferase [Thermodesulfobacteriota bacterium]
MDRSKSAKQLAKTIEYALGRCPDEFGLVLDAEGYVKIKTLLKAISEEDGWRHVRHSHIDELFILLKDPPIEIRESRIRALFRERIPAVETPKNIPKTLYICIRRRGYPVVLEKGILPADSTHVILTGAPEQALRLGRRIDPEPILLTVHVRKAIELGSQFYQYGETLYLADSIPSDSFSGPPLPKEKERAANVDERRETGSGRTAGSFFLEFPMKENVRKNQGGKKKSDAGRTKDLKRIRKEKDKMWNR